MGSSHSSGPSSYEIAMEQQKAEEAEQARLKAEKEKSIQAANSAPETEGAQGGDAEKYAGGALAAKKKKGSTLAGEGEQTFGKNGSLGG